MYRIAVAEDDPAYVKMIQNYLTRYASETGEALQADYFPDGSALVAAYAPVYHLLMMDIEMPRMNGMDAARAIRQRDTEVQILFLTRMAQYALRGYEVHALDFVLKPISYQMFSLKLKQILAQLRLRERRSVVLTTQSGMLRLPTHQVYYIEVSNHRLIYHTEQGEFKTAGSIAGAAEELESAGFTRCNSGTLVNLRYVTEVRGSEATVAGEKLPISRSRRKAFLQEIADYVGGLR